MGSPTAAAARRRGLSPARARELASVVPLTVALVALHETDLLADVPLWVYVVGLWGAYGLSRLASVLVPRDAPDRRLWLRAGMVVAATTFMIYLTGGGPTLAVGYLAVAADQVNSCGSRILRPVLVWSLLGLAAGQGAIAAGLAPTRIDEPLVHGLAVLTGLAVTTAMSLFGLTTHQKEDSQRTATLLLALAEDLAGATTEAEVCDRIAAAVPRLIGLERATVTLWDPAAGAARVVATRGVPPPNLAVARAHAFRPEELPRIADRVRAGRPFAVRRDDPDFAEEPVLWQDATEVLVAPITARGQFLGVISAARTEGRPQGLSGEIGARLAGIAAQAAAALERARLIAAERRVAEQLRRTDRAKSEFLAVVSHELRTPIAVMLGAARTLQWRAGEIDERTRHDLAESIVRRAEQLGRLVSDLLLSAGDISLELDDVDVAGLIRSAVADARALYPDAEITAELVPGGPGGDGGDGGDPPALFVRADPYRLRQVLDNLIGNARKYAPDSPVVVRAGRDGDRVWFAVADRGPGMDAEHAERAFEPFFQADSSSVRRAGGLGLGLHICRRIVEAHGGTIRLDTAPGAGTTVTVTLPARAPGAPAAAVG
jgi:signal transduction histidine kinase